MHFAPKLPEPLGKLAAQISLHDGLIRKVLFDRSDEISTFSFYQRGDSNEKPV